MDFQLTPEEEAIRDTARAFAQEAMAPHAARWDEAEEFPVETLRAAARLGFAGIYVSEPLGGAGLNRMAASIVFEELAAACPSSAAYLSIQNMVAWMVERFGSPALRQRWVPALASLDAFASYCLTEPGAGSDAASLETRAVRQGDHYVLSGTKAFISGGSHSDLYLVMARTGGAGPGGISAFLVERGSAGLSFGAKERKLGWRCQPTTMVIMDGVKVPEGNRLGEDGAGFRYAMQGLDGGRINIASCSLGGARAALEQAVQHLRLRRQFGRNLSEFQALRFRIADMATELEAARLMVRCAAAAFDTGAPDTTLRAAMAKRFATDICFRITDAAIQLHGGYGYLRDYPIERYFRDLRVHQILEGTNEIMRLIIARHWLDG